MSSTPCYICGKGMEEVRLDGRDLRPRPCTTCEDVISETAGLRADDPGMTWGELALIMTSTDESENEPLGETDLGYP